MSQRGTTQKDINATVRAQQALNLRKQGYTLQEVAQQCGYQDKSGAWRAIKRELDRIPVDDAKDVRNLELIRLDAMLKACFPKATSGDTWSVDRVLAIMERRAKLLGLDTPVNDGISSNITVIREIPPGYLSVEAVKSE